MHDQDSRAIEEIERACRVIARGGILSISVVTGRRLSDDHLRTVREYASMHGVYLASDGNGTVTLRAGLKERGRSHRFAAARALWQAVRIGLAPRHAGSDAR
jgi:hypothetical protein